MHTNYPARPNPVGDAILYASGLLFASWLLLAPGHAKPTAGELAHFIVQVHASKNGSGVIIESSNGVTSILTARHVVQATHLSENPFIRTIDGRSHRISSIESSSLLDLAVLTIDASDYAVPRLNGGFEGGSITIVGYPNRTGKLSAATGIAESPGSTPLVRKGGYSLRHNVRTEDGLSGGGVFNNSGELVGIHGQSDMLITSKGNSYRSSTGQAIPIRFWIIARSRGGLAGTTSDMFPPPTSATDMSLIGSELLSSGRPAEALDYFQRAAALDPHEISHIGNEATAMIALGQINDAHDLLSKAIQANPTNMSLRLNLANAAYDLGLDRQALDELNWILMKSGDVPIALQNRAQVLMRMKRYDEAERDVNVAIPLLSQPIEAYRMRARIKLIQGMREKALEDLTQVVASMEAEPTDWVNRALLFIDLGEEASARNDLRQALWLENANPDANKAMGLLDSKANKHMLAIKSLENALQSRPHDPEVLSILGQNYYKLGQHSLACKFHKQATAYGQNWMNGQWDPDYLKKCP